MAKAINKHLDKHIIQGTNLQVIGRDKPLLNNKSGVIGVHWDKSRQRWVAQINFQGKHYNLGRFKNKEDAVNARKEAEEKFFRPIIESNKIK